jgi:hypothetical protein
MAAIELQDTGAAAPDRTGHGSGPVLPGAADAGGNAYFTVMVIFFE